MVSDYVHLFGGESTLITNVAVTISRPAWSIAIRHQENYQQRRSLMVEIAFQIILSYFKCKVRLVLTSGSV